MKNKIIYQSFFVCLFLITLNIHNLFSQKVIIPFGATWKYLDDGSDQGIKWKNSTFDDSNWKIGEAQLGYGDDGEKTIVDFGPDPNNKFITTYFRYEFGLKNISEYVGFLMGLRYDDGAVIYINGKECTRTNIVRGFVKYNTLALSGAGEDEYFIDKEIFKEGKNVIAVEIHQCHPRSSDIRFDLRLMSTNYVPDIVRKSPYLIYTGITSKIKLCWQLRKTIKCNLFWGLDTLYNLGNQVVNEYGNDHQYFFTFNKLKSNAKYYYKVLIDDRIFKGSFKSAPGPDVNKVSFLVYGDTRTYPENHDAVASVMLSTVFSNVDLQSMILFNGDFVGNGNSESCWDREFFSDKHLNIRKLLANMPLQACLGNHEGVGVLFEKYFPYPSGVNTYWSFDYGPAHIVVLDQYINDLEQELNQIIWLKSDLNKTRKKWKFIVVHEPGWSAGGGHSNNKEVQKILQPIFEENNVSIVFAGHNHYYARAEVNGIQHVTTGGGGAPLYEPNDKMPNIVIAKMVYHFCKVEIDEDELNFSAISTDGAVIDEFKLIIE